MSNTPFAESEFVELITGAQRCLHSYIRCLVGATSDVDDILQETNSDLWRRRKDYDFHKPFLPWAYGFAFQRVRAHRTKSNRSKLVFSETIFEQIASCLQSESVILTQSAEHLRHCLNQLPDAHREAIMERYERGSSVSVIAQNLGKTPGSVSNLLFRIRKKLMRCIRQKVALNE